MPDGKSHIRHRLNKILRFVGLCPKCHGKLASAGSEQQICLACGRRFTR